MSLDSLMAKYDPFAKQAAKTITPESLGSMPQVLTSWQDSMTVMRLSEYLKQHKDQGITLYQSESGGPSLHFSPGLIRADMETERWQIARNAVDLLWDASVDLRQLLTCGLITLPTHQSVSISKAARGSYPTDMKSALKEEERI